MFIRVILICLFLGAMCAAETKPPKQGTYYKLDDLGISKTVVEGSNIKLTFKPKDEQFYWCPGAKVQVTQKATAVTFLRCETSEPYSVDVKATIGKRLIRTITIDTQGKDVYVRISPKKFKRIYKQPKPTKAQPVEIKKARGLIKNQFAVVDAISGA